MFPQHQGEGMSCLFWDVLSSEGTVSSAALEEHIVKPSKMGAVGSQTTRVCGTGRGSEELWEQQQGPELAPRLPQ